MEVNGTTFKRAVSLTGRFNNELAKFIDTIGFEIESDAPHYWGFSIPKNRYEEPELDELEEVLDIVGEFGEDRYERLLEDTRLTPSELKSYQQNLVVNVAQDGDHGGYFYGQISFKEATLFVIVERRGYAFSGLDLDLMGMFKTLDAASEQLFPDAVFFKRDEC